jgi:hypothetical protein
MLLYIGLVSPQLYMKFQLSFASLYIILVPIVTNTVIT